MARSFWSETSEIERPRPPASPLSKTKSESLATGDLGLKGAINHSDWISAHKGGTSDVLVGRKCGREDYSPMEVANEGRFKRRKIGATGPVSYVHSGLASVVDPNSCPSQCPALGQKRSFTPMSPMSTLRQKRVPPRRPSLGCNAGTGACVLFLQSAVMEGGQHQAGERPRIIHHVPDADIIARLFSFWQIKGAE